MKGKKLIEQSMFYEAKPEIFQKARRAPPLPERQADLENKGSAFDRFSIMIIPGQTGFLKFKFHR
ncbi:MAG: hypothetical protein ABIJ97_03550 [Bacteroidota bacterium]